MRKILLILILVFTAYSLQIGVYSQAIAQTNKVVMIIAENNFQDDEFFIPKKVLETNGIEVTVASTSLDEATGMLGATVKPDILVADIEVTDFDVILFVGGSGAVQYLDDSRAHNLAWEAIRENRIVAAICIAPVILANAGILEGRQATVWPSEGNKLQAKGVIYTGQPVEIDGNIITSSGPAAATEFGEEIVKALNR
ncbi:MAG: DJ-1/PfpI family protein [Candidatus Omnitrophota bacterium]